MDMSPVKSPTTFAVGIPRMWLPIPENHGHFWPLRRACYLLSQVSVRPGKVV